MNLPEVTAVVVTWNPGADLADCIRNIEADGRPAALHIVDSGSDDGSVEAFAATRPDIRVTRLSGNPGPAATRNRGLRDAGTPLVLLVDHDVRILPGTLGALREALLSDPARAAAAPRTFHARDPERIQYDGGFWHCAGLPHLRGQNGAAVAATTGDVDVLTGSCLLVRRDAALGAGGFDESFFYLMEDIEFCLRLRWLGHRLASVPSARCTNAGGSEGLSLRGARYPVRRARLHARNRCLTVLGLYDARTLLVLWPALLLLDAAWFVFAILAGTPLAFLRGKAEILPRLRGILAKRRSFLPRKRIPDRVLLGAPPLTLTETALAQPMVRRLSRLLDGSLRILWLAGRGFLA